MHRWFKICILLGWLGLGQGLRVREVLFTAVNGKWEFVALRDTGATTRLAEAELMSGTQALLLVWGLEDYATSTEVRSLVNEVNVAGTQIIHTVIQPARHGGEGSPSTTWSAVVYRTAPDRARLLEDLHATGGAGVQEALEGIGEGWIGVRWDVPRCGRKQHSCRINVRGFVNAFDERIYRGVEDPLETLLQLRVQSPNQKDEAPIAIVAAGGFMALVIICLVCSACFRHHLDTAKRPLTMGRSGNESGESETEINPTDAAIRRRRHVPSDGERSEAVAVDIEFDETLGDETSGDENANEKKQLNQRDVTITVT